ncbi:MAG: HAD family phosphatase [Chitinophagaceae bacterium]|nr:HAD family phosphatase [Chitinophagaceae bacterium]
MIRAVIFDFDGVLADTMFDNCKAWQDAFKAYGFYMDAMEYYKLEGMGRFQIAQYFIDKYFLEPSIKNTVAEAKEMNYKKNNSFKYYDYVYDIFSFLSEKGIPTAIVTGASTARINEHLDENISKSLKALVTAEDVINTKPHPEPYLQAASMLGMNAKECLVIENAILGIHSAKSAGCTCFALETTLNAADLTEADEVFDSHKNLFIKLMALFN